MMIHIPWALPPCPVGIHLHSLCFSNDLFRIKKHQESPPKNYKCVKNQWNKSWGKSCKSCIAATYINTLHKLFFFFWGLRFLLSRIFTIIDLDSWGKKCWMPVVTADPRGSSCQTLTAPELLWRCLCWKVKKVISIWKSALRYKVCLWPFITLRRGKK